MQNAWLEKLKECRICPRNCGVNRLAGETGFCGAGENVRIARAALHHWEEPVISGNRGSGTVFFSFCSLGCVFCQNQKISQEGNGLEVSIERLSEIFLELQEQGAHNINLVTPTHYIPQIAMALTLAKANGLKILVVYNSSGYETVEGLRMMDGLVDVYLPDVKFMDGKISKVMANCEDYFEVAINALEEMFKQVGEPLFDSEGMMTKGVIARHLLLPGQLKAAEEITRKVFERYGNRMFYSLMNQYTPMENLAPSISENLPGNFNLNVDSDAGAGVDSNTAVSVLVDVDTAFAVADNAIDVDDAAKSAVDVLSMLQNKVSNDDYEEWVDFAMELGLENGFIQEGETALESFIPAFDFQGVRKKD